MVLHSYTTEFPERNLAIDGGRELEEGEGSGVGGAGKVRICLFQKKAAMTVPAYGILRSNTSVCPLAQINGVPVAGQSSLCLAGVLLKKWPELEKQQGNLLAPFFSVLVKAEEPGRFHKVLCVHSPLAC